VGAWLKHLESTNHLPWKMFKKKTKILHNWLGVAKGTRINQLYSVTDDTEVYPLFRIITLDLTPTFLIREGKITGLQQHQERTCYQLNKHHIPDRILLGVSCLGEYPPTESFNPRFAKASSKFVPYTTPLSSCTRVSFPEISV
jgi:hypothetical protein